MSSAAQQTASAVLAPAGQRPTRHRWATGAVGLAVAGALAVTGAASALAQPALPAPAVSPAAAATVVPQGAGEATVAPADGHAAHRAATPAITLSVLRATNPHWVWRDESTPDVGSASATA